MYNQEIEEFLDHTPVTEDEALGIMPNGVYEGYIRKMEVKPGKKDPNQKFFVATIEVFTNTGALKTITQYLFSDKLRKHIYDACGLEEKFKTAKLSTKDCEGKNVLVKIGRQDGNEQFPDPKNVILDFIKLKESKPVLTINGQPEEEFFNDDVPF